MSGYIIIQGIAFWSLHQVIYFLFASDDYYPSIFQSVSILQKVWLRSAFDPQPAGPAEQGIGRERDGLHSNNRNSRWNPCMPTTSEVASSRPIVARSCAAHARSYHMHVQLPTGPENVSSHATLRRYLILCRYIRARPPSRSNLPLRP